MSRYRPNKERVYANLSSKLKPVFKAVPGTKGKVLYLLVRDRSRAIVIYTTINQLYTMKRYGAWFGGANYAKWAVAASNLDALGEPQVVTNLPKRNEIAEYFGALCDFTDYLKAEKIVRGFKNA